jgi:hypothetical protein
MRAASVTMGNLITGPDLCRPMGKASRVTAEQEFGLHRLVAETLAASRRSSETLLAIRFNHGNPKPGG